MKKIKLNKKIFTLIFLLGILLPLNYNAEDFNLTTTYGNRLSKIQAYASWYSTNENSTVSLENTAGACTSKGGTFDTSSCLWSAYTYQATCIGSQIYWRSDKSNIYQQTLTYTGKNLGSQTAANNKCKESIFYWYYKNRATGTCSKADKCSNSRTSGVSFKEVECPYSSGTKVTIGGVSGYSSSNVNSNCKPRYLGCKCTMINKTISYNEGYTTLYSGTYYVNDKPAYCISPSKPHYIGEHVDVNLGYFDIASCSTDSPNAYSCGIADIYDQAEKKGYISDETAILIALRLWTSSKEEGTESWGPETSVANPVYKITADRVLSNGYTGQKKWTDGSYVIGLLVATDDASLASLQHGIELFKHAKDNTFKAGSNEGIVVRQTKKSIDIKKNGSFELEFTANFSDETTKDISFAFEDSRITYRYELVKESGLYKYKISGKFSNFNRLKSGCTSDGRTIGDINITLKYKDSRDKWGNLHIIQQAGNPDGYQKYVTFQSGDTEKTVKLTYTTTCKTFECEEPATTNFPESCDEGTFGLHKDEGLDCIINDEQIQPKYDYSSRYVKSTQSKNYSVNNYCKIQCREDITLQMYDHVYQVEGNRFFKYDISSMKYNGNALMAEIIGDRECTTEINYDKWKKDYEAANKAVLDTWNTYKKYENLHKLTSIQHPQQSCSMSYGCSRCPCWSCNCHSCGKDGKSTCCSTCCSTSCSGPCSTTMHWSVWPSTPYRVTNANGSTSMSSTSFKDGYIACGGNNCSGKYCNSRNGNDNYFAGMYSTSKSSYETAVKKREELLAYIQDCNLADSYKLNEKMTSGYTRSKEDSTYYRATNGYEFNPTLSYEYFYPDKNTPTRYNSMIKIEQESKLTGEIIFKYCSNGECAYKEQLGATATEKVKYWVCTGQGTSAICKINEIVVPKNKRAYIKFQKTSYYWQGQKFYSRIPDGEISTSAQNNYLPLSDENVFPLGFDMDGTFPTKSDYGALGDKYRTVKIEGGSYTCDYYTVPKIPTCPECEAELGGGDPVCDNPPCPASDDSSPNSRNELGYYYRSIDLDNVFPSGVKTGTWSTTQAQKLIDDIQSKGESIYTPATVPNYEFVVTPANIRQIKEYNKQQERNGSSGYNDFNLTCECQTGICYCESDFLKDISTGGSLSRLVTSYKRNGVTQ